MGSRPSRGYVAGLALSAAVLVGCVAQGRAFPARDAGPSIDGAPSTGDATVPPGDALVPTDARPVELDATGPTRDGEIPSDGAPHDAGPIARPVRALLAAHEDSSPAVASIVANAGYATIHEVLVPVLAGDVLRVRAQIEMTNDYMQPVRGAIRIVIDGAPTGTWGSQNAIFDGNHHMPLWADATFVAGADGTVNVEAQQSAGRSDASPSVLIENGYGHVVVEQYRQFDSREDAAAAGARLLASVTQDRSEDSATFGTTGASVRTPVHGIDVAANAGDLLRIYAQTTSVWTAAGFDMHGHGIFTGDARLGPWATENTPWAIQTVPLWSDAVHMAAGATPLFVTMHGVVGIGGGVLAGGGHLTALRFVSATHEDASWSLEDSLDGVGPAADTSILANSGAQTLYETPVALAAGTVIRAVGTVELAHPAGFAQGISCIAQLELLAGGAVVQSSPIAAKYVTPTLEVLPLRAELFTEVGPAAADAIRLRGTCSREGASPAVAVLGEGTHLLVDTFAPL